MDTVKIIEALNKPAEKLIDVISKGIGTVYEPHKIKKLADAEAYRIETISNALSLNDCLPIGYNKDGLEINTINFEELQKRAASRFVFQEISHQINIESIADKAYDMLTNEAESDAGPVSEEWISRFISSSQDVTDNEIQNIWARLLAGEIKNPNTYSLRILNVLKNMTNYEIKLLEKIMPYVISNEYIPNENEYLEKANISYSEILALDECGVINSSGMLSKNIEISGIYSTIAFNGDYVLIGNSKETKKIKLSIFELSGVGKELVSIINNNKQNDLFFEYSKIINNKYQNDDISISLHKINSINGNQVNFSLEDLLKEDNLNNCNY